MGPYFGEGKCLFDMTLYLACLRRLSCLWSYIYSHAWSWTIRCQNEEYVTAYSYWRKATLSKKVSRVSVIPGPGWQKSSFLVQTECFYSEIHRSGSQALWWCSGAARARHLAGQSLLSSPWSALVPLLTQNVRVGRALVVLWKLSSSPVVATEWPHVSAVGVKLVGKGDRKLSLPSTWSKAENLAIVRNTGSCGARGRWRLECGAVLKPAQLAWERPGALAVARVLPCYVGCTRTRTGNNVDYKVVLLCRFSDEGGFLLAYVHSSLVPGVSWGTHL